MKVASMAQALRWSPRVFVSCATITVILAFHGMNARAGEALLGVQQGPGCTGTARVANFVKWFGREPDLMLDFLDNRSWRDITATGWWINCRAKAGRKVVWSVPMFPSDGTSTLAQGAGGAYDGYFKQIAAALIAGGFRDAIVRVGWEFNADWFTWAAGK